LNLKHIFLKKNLDLYITRAQTSAKTQHWNEASGKYIRSILLNCQLNNIQK